MDNKEKLTKNLKLVGLLQVTWNKMFGNNQLIYKSINISCTVNT